MFTAESKAALARAYASGAKPRFMRVLPGGANEVWALAQALIVVPVVPADASPELEVALRLRRDALVEGRCPGCGAVPGLEALVDGPTPMSVALFKHRFACPARDEHVQRLLDQAGSADDSAYMERRLEHMTSSSRARVARIADGGVLMSGPGAEERTMELLDRLMQHGDPSVCPHLAEDPLQVWTTLIAEGTWQCDQCWAYFLEQIRQGFRLAPVEEHTCDLCRRYAPISLEPLMLRVDNFIMHGGVCGACWSTYAPEEPEEIDEG